MGDVLPPGTRLGRYEIVQRLALGGMAEIYLARMSGLAGFAKHVVLKRILPSHARDAEFVRMFFNEARYAATLDHPNIAHVYDLGEEQGLHYFTMEYLHGEDCRTLLRELTTRGIALPMAHALTIVVGAAAGCHFAHELAGDDGEPLGLIHRDVSPSNVVVTYAGAVKLVDFGIAKATNLEDVTAIGVTKGKLAYMAPEQCRGEPLDRRVDVYALGVLLYELTTQRRAFQGQNDANVMWAVVSGEVPPPSTHVKDYPPALAAIIARAMHVDRAQRYATARELSQAVEAFARDAGLTLNPAALGEFLERTMGPKLEPWKTAGADGKAARAKTPNPAGDRSSPVPRVDPPGGGASGAGAAGAGGAGYGGGAGAAGAGYGAPGAGAGYGAPGAGGAGYGGGAGASLPVGADFGGAAGPGGGSATHASRDAETAAEMAVTTPRMLPTGSREPAARTRSPLVILGAATVAAAALVGGALYWRQRDRARSSDGDVVLIAERGNASIERDGGAGIAAAPAESDAAAIDPAAPIDAAVATAVDASPAPARRADAGTARPPRPTDALSGAFARREDQVTRCFATHATGVVQQPELTLRFEIDTAGVPTKVEILPSDLGRTPLGECILAVGRSTRFPAQPAPTAFRIPVKVRTSGGGT